MQKLMSYSSVVLLMTAIGCSPSGSGNSTLSGTDASEEISQSLDTASEKIYIDQASLEQIAPYKVVTNSGANVSSKPKKEKIYIQICHVPPGNPANCHDHVLPLESMKAHLGHGDYLGYCDSEDNGEEPAPSPTPTATPEPSPTPSASPEPNPEPTPEASPSPSPSASPTPAATPPGEADIPQWCIPYVEIDSDCDGYVDADGSPLL